MKIKMIAVEMEDKELRGSFGWVCEWCFFGCATEKEGKPKNWSSASE
jgi:hypothetical protein